MSDYSHPSGSLYAYQPSQALPITFAIITLILGVALAYQSIIHRWHYFNYLTTVASLAWFAGFIIRTIITFQISDIMVYIKLWITQHVLIFMGPPLFAASESFILGRLLAYMPYHAPLHPGRTISTFVILNAVVEALAVNGVARTASQNATDAQRALGLHLVQASLILQMIVELCFIILVATFQRHGRRAGKFPHNARVLCRVLYITSWIMMVRCAVRIIEGFEIAACPALTQFWCGTIRRNEWFLWVFEVANISLFVAALTVWHPGRFLPNDTKVYLDPHDRKTERMGPGYGTADKRHLIITVLDPFDMVGSLRGENKMDRFWERDNPIVVRAGSEGHSAAEVSGEVVEVELELVTKV